MLKVVYALLFVVIFVVALLFSLKNVQPVSINLLVGNISMPLALALTLELLAGVAIGATVQFTYLLRLKAENGRLKKNLAFFERELEELRSHQAPAND